jgi:hypothetical protein
MIEDINIRIAKVTYKRLEKQKANRKDHHQYKKHIDDLSKLPAKLIDQFFDEKLNSKSIRTDM